MKLSLSVRIAEGFLSKEEALLDIEQLAALTRDAGYDAVCMRASQVGVHSDPDRVTEVIRVLRASDLPVSMVTGDFDTVYNNQRGPDALDRITPYLDLAERLGASLIRVALKQPTDIARAQRAADESAERGIRLAHQCHTLSLFETVDGIELTLREIGRENFGLIYEPANLEICGQPYGRDVIQRLSRWIFNVYLQNQILKPDGAITLDTWCCGPVSFDLHQIHDPGGVDFAEVFAGLKSIGYDGTVTVHQSAGGAMTPVESATATARFLRGLL